MSLSYQQTVDYLFSRLPVYQHIGKAAYKADLNNTIALCEALGNPQNSFRSIHVAGTNGKGSVSSLLAAILSENGYKIGLYTSPHLKDFRERIRINGEMIPESTVIEFTERVKPLIETINPSFFELTVAMAFEFFAKEKVDYAVIEVGMGGRLDSTNVISPILSIITNIGFDHMEFLGSTLAQIAFEKAGIIKPLTPVVIGEILEETKTVFEEKAGLEKSPIYFAKDVPIDWINKCPLKGDYQAKNLATVFSAVQILKENKMLELTEEKILKGIENVVFWTGLKGRWQVLNVKPFMVADTAHNEHGLKIVLNQMLAISHKKLHIILGVVNDKDLNKILPLFPKNASYYFCKPAIMRGLDAEILQTQASGFGLFGNVFESVSEAVVAAKKNAEKEDVIYIGGSTFVVAEVVD